MVLCRCDNQAVVKVLSICCCRDQKLMHLMRYLFFFKAHFQFHMISSHIRGSSNDLADDLSRNNLLSFLQKSGTQAPASPIPRELLDMLILFCQLKVSLTLRNIYYVSIFQIAYDLEPSKKKLLALQYSHIIN